MHLCCLEQVVRVRLGLESTSMHREKSKLNHVVPLAKDSSVFVDKRNGFVASALCWLSTEVMDWIHRVLSPTSNGWICQLFAPFSSPVSPVSNPLTVFKQRKDLCHEQKEKRCHILGAEIRYQCLNNTKYPIQTKRDILDESSANIQSVSTVLTYSAHIGCVFFPSLTPHHFFAQPLPRGAQCESSFWTFWVQLDFKESKQARTSLACVGVFAYFYLLKTKSKHNLVQLKTCFREWSVLRNVCTWYCNL